MPFSPSNVDFLFVERSYYEIELIDITISSHSPSLIICLVSCGAHLSAPSSALYYEVLKFTINTQGIIDSTPTIMMFCMSMTSLLPLPTYSEFFYGSGLMKIENKILTYDMQHILIIINGRSPQCVLRLKHCDHRS